MYWYCETYSYTEVLVSTTKLILVLRILYLYYEVYPGLTELILVFRSTYWYFGSYTCITELIQVFQVSYMYYRTYTCLTKLTGLTEHILILRILSLCEGTRKYNKSVLIIIVSHTGPDQTYADTYQVWTLVHSRYRS